jgi:hypothetical protein
MRPFNTNTSAVPQKSATSYKSVVHHNKMMEEPIRELVKSEGVMLDSAQYFNQVSIMDEINMNSGWLISLLKNIEMFQDVRYRGIGAIGKQNPDYYYAQHELLGIMYDLLECKMKEEEIKQCQQILDALEISIDTLFIQNTSGELLFIVQKAKNIRKDLAKLFRYYLNFMEKRGILTKKTMNPQMAMAEFMD